MAGAFPDPFVNRVFLRIQYNDSFIYTDLDTRKNDFEYNSIKDVKVIMEQILNVEPKNQKLIRPSRPGEYNAVTLKDEEHLEDLVDREVTATAENPWKIGLITKTSEQEDFPPVPEFPQISQPTDVPEVMKKRSRHAASRQ